MTEEATPTPPEAAVEAETPPNGVLVTKITDESGGIRTALQILGNVQITEAQFLLELGIKEFRDAVGLGQAGR